MARYQDSIRYRSNRHNGVSKVTVILGSVIAFVVVVGLVLGISALVSKGSETHTATCTVNDKYVFTKVTNGNSETEKRVETSCGVFTVNDSFFKGARRSADTYAKLQKGHTYTLTYNGWRSGWTSSFPNITKAVEVQ